MYADTWLAEIFRKTGREEEAEAVLCEAIAIGEQGIFPGIKIRCEPSMHHFGRGEIRAAEELHHRAQDAASELGHPCCTTAGCHWQKPI